MADDDQRLHRRGGYDEASARQPCLPGVCPAAHRLHCRPDPVRARQVPRLAGRLAYLPGAPDRRPPPGQRRPGDARRRRHRGRSRRRRCRPTQVRWLPRSRLARRDHRQPAAAGRFLRCCPARLWAPPRRAESGPAGHRVRPVRRRPRLRCEHPHLGRRREPRRRQGPRGGRPR
jgi:hypothetical protein